MKVMTIVGTRPEIIRLSRVIDRLDRTLDHVLVHTGQNYDHGLSQVFFDDLELRQPDHYLAVDTSSLGSVLGGTLQGVERVIAEERPDAVLVLGDTNSCIAAVMAKRMRVPVYHMEAGNRCFDENVPEETNRRLVDHVADFNLAYTEHARRNLLAEGLHARRVIVTGSPMREVLEHYRPQIDASEALGRLGVAQGGYFLVSAHREENVDDPDRLRMLLDCLEGVRDRWSLPVVVSTHPRTRKRLEALGVDTSGEAVRFLEPFGFHDYNRLQLGAACVLSDSGTISEESAILGFPAVTLRDSIERPEALDAGTIMMTGLDRADVLRAVEIAMTDGPVTTSMPAGYEIADTSNRVVRFIVSTAGRHHAWAGIRRAAQVTLAAERIGVGRAASTGAWPGWDPAPGAHLYVALLQWTYTRSSPRPSATSTWAIGRPCWWGYVLLAAGVVGLGLLCTRPGQQALRRRGSWLHFLLAMAPTMLMRRSRRSCLAASQSDSAWPWRWPGSACCCRCDGGKSWTCPLPQFTGALRTKVSGGLWLAGLLTISVAADLLTLLLPGMSHPIVSFGHGRT